MRRSITRLRDLEGDVLRDLPAGRWAGGLMGGVS